MQQQVQGEEFWKPQHGPAWESHSAHYADNLANLGLELFDIFYTSLFNPKMVFYLLFAKLPWEHKLNYINLQNKPWGQLLKQLLWPLTPAGLGRAEENRCEEEEANPGFLRKGTIFMRSLREFWANQEQ